MRYGCSLIFNSSSFFGRFLLTISKLENSVKLKGLIISSKLFSLHTLKREVYKSVYNFRFRLHLLFYCILICFCLKFWCSFLIILFFLFALWQCRSIVIDLSSRVKQLTMAAAGDGITIDSIIEKLLLVRGARPGKQVSFFHSFASRFVSVDSYEIALSCTHRFL
jgi:hypothetical protein